MKISQFKLSTKIIVQALMIVVCFSLVLTWVFLRLKEKIYDEKVVATRHVVEVAYSILMSYENRAQKGELKLEEAQKRAMTAIQNLRYEEKEYFWINDLHPRMVMHPFKPELNGKDLTDHKDPNGKRLFVEFVNVCKEKGAGVVEYMWPKHDGSKPEPKISYVKLFKPWGWIVGSGIYIDDMKKEMAQVFYVIFIVGGMIIIGGLVFAFVMARSISKPIYKVVDGLMDGAEQVSSASGQVSSASQSLAEGASEQAAGIEETSSSIEEMASMTRQNADNANQANLLMSETTKVVEEANQSMVELTESMKEISAASEETAKIIKTIDEIAFQTNLLALNAAVEAARAGEAGAGFAVVADEVRNLAMRAADAAKNTANLIEGTVKKIRNGSEIVTRTNEAFGKVATGAKKASELVGEIAAASQEQAQGIEQINKAVSEMDRVVQKNAASAEESASAAEEMSAQAETMKGYVSELMALVGGRNGNGVSSNADFARPDQVGRLRIAELRKSGGNGKKSASRLVARVTNGAKKKEAVMPASIQKELKPEQVIPMGDGSFKEF